jgi:uncharacterized protein YkwD
MTTPARLRYTFVAGATAVVIGVGFTMAGLDRQSPDTPRARSADAPLVTDAPPPGDPGPDPGLLPSEDAASATPPARTSPAATTPVRPLARPSSARPSSARPATSKPKPRQAGTTVPSPRQAPATSGSITDRVLDHINDARADAGLPRYALDGDLSRAAARHNQRMIDGCGLSHQCPGEGGIGTRFSAEGVRWTSAGENIGLASAGRSDADIIRAADGLTDSMLAETPPNDGHRKNLLSRAFERIGLSVIRDGKGTVWLTQDFAG